MGIRSKLVLLVSAPVALTFVGVALAVTEMQRTDRVRELQVRHALALEAVGVAAASYLEASDVPGLRRMVATVSRDRPDPDLRELAVISTRGEVLAHSEPGHIGRQAADGFSLRAMAENAAISEEKEEILWIGVPARAVDRQATIIAAYSTERIAATLLRVRVALLAVAVLIGAVLCGVLLTTLYRLVIRPVKTLQGAARLMGEGRLDARVPELGQGELAELGDTFNRMAAALKTQHENLEQIVADRTQELREANVRLETLAVTDGLTGVYNHRRFQETLAQESLRAERNGRPFSVLFIDVDHFKRFNDSMGHPAGDEVLRQLAALLKRFLRSSDLLARYGGEEFAALLADARKEYAVQVAERLRLAVERELNETPMAPRVTISVGISTHGFDGSTPQQLLVAADRALYIAKQTGRNRVVAAGLSSLEKRTG